jgi:hypothetical protein
LRGDAASGQGVILPPTRRALAHMRLKRAHTACPHTCSLQRIVRNRAAQEQRLEKPRMMGA